MVMKIPENLQDLTTDWLTEALRKGGVIKKSSVTSLKAEPITGKGFIGQNYLLDIHYDRDEEEAAPQTIFVKCSNTDLEKRQEAVELRVYEREVNFYQKIAPKTTLPVPACYYSDIDLEAGSHVILLEDLAPALNGDQEAGCTIKEAYRAVKAIAEFHAVWWECPDLYAMEWLPNLHDIYDYEAIQNVVPQIWELFLLRTKHKLPDTIKDTIDNHGQDFIVLNYRLFKERPQTLVHFDFTLDNLFFASAEEGLPFAVIDWQLMTRGRGTFDIAFLLGRNLDPAIRKENEFDILTLYHNTLLNNGVVNYTIDQCLRDYRLSLLYLLSHLSYTVAEVKFTEEEKQFHIEVLLPRICSAIIDNSAMEMFSTL